MQRARSEEQKDARRQILLNAALDEFFEKGFSAARMDDIAARAKVSKGTVYLYFSGKDVLFTELIESLTSPRLAQLDVIATSALSIREAMAAVAQLGPQIVRTSDLPRLLKVLIGDSHLFPDTVRAYRVTVLERVLGAITTILTSARDRREIDIGDPSLTARLVIAPILFSGVWQAMFGRDPDAQVDLEHLFELHASMLLKGMAANGVGE